MILLTILIFFNFLLNLKSNQFYNEINYKLILNDKSNFNLNYFYHWEMFQLDIRKTTSLELKDTFFGKIFNMKIKRIIKNQSCNVKECQYCHGKGYLTTETPDQTYHQSLISPCPMCLGLKYAADNCMLYSTIEETVIVDLPKGCTPGYFVKMPGKGNEAMIKGTDTFKTGDLYIDIDKISTGYFNVTKRGLELLVLMTPKEALEGFNRSLPMFSGSTIQINRLNKTTFPGTEVILSGMGIPIANTERRGSLYVIYEFEEDKSVKDTQLSSKSVRVNANGEEEIIDLDQLITTQEEYEAWYEKQKQIEEQRRQDNIIKRILLKMKREIDRKKRKENEENGHGEDKDHDEDEDDVREEKT